MKPRDLFGVAIRGIGIWILTQAAYWGFYAFLKLQTTMGNPSIPPQEDAAMAVFYLVLGILLIVLADSIVRAVYGAPSKRHEDAGTAPDAASPS